MSLHQHNPYGAYVMQHYAPQNTAPPQQPQQPQPPTPANATTVAPSDTYTQQASGSGQQSPLVAQGDWTKNLVQLAKTAELKKHALTLQLHTAHILSAHSTLEAKNKALQDIKEQKNRLESERTRLLNCLREVNEDRDKARFCGSRHRCGELRSKIQAITDGDYAVAKREVDQLRGELGQPPVPSLQQTLEEKNAAYLTERRINGAPGSGEVTPVASAGVKRVAAEPAAAETPGKRPRGRPKGSKNRTKSSAAAAGASAGGGGGGEAAGE
ncbi:hypothetical protein DFH11DRAFT_1687865 [Phellopilus nigrolimitatus]|nr:hypothetical protein DFH11DRAFT_1687865 [Phellopilus nigrolimitatus]